MNPKTSSYMFVSENSRYVYATSKFHCHGQQAASSKSACTRGSCRTGPPPHGRYPMDHRSPHVWGGKQQPCRQVCRTSSNYTRTLGGLLVHITKMLLTPRAARRPPPMPGHPGAEQESYALQKKKRRIAAQNYTGIIILLYNITLSYHALE